MYEVQFSKLLNIASYSVFLVVSFALKGSSLYNKNDQKLLLYSKLHSKHLFVVKV